MSVRTATSFHQPMIARTGPCRALRTAPRSASVPDLGVSRASIAIWRQRTRPTAL